MNQNGLRHRRIALPLAAAALALLATLALWAPVAQARERRTESRRATCSGAIEGSSFHFKCDQQIGGNSRGWLFGFYSHGLSRVDVNSPGGISCASERGRVTCKGPPIPANATVSGSFSAAPPSEEEGEEPGEGPCPGGTSLIVVAYGGDSAEGEPGEEEEGEGPGEVIPVPEGLARFGINSCGTGSEGPRGEEGGTFSFGKVKLHKEQGTAALPVKVTAAGTLSLHGENLVKVTKTAKAAGTVRLTVKPRGAAKGLLHATGHVTVKAVVTYTPGSGEPTSKSKKIKLQLV